MAHAFDLIADYPSIFLAIMTIISIIYFTLFFYAHKIKDKRILYLAIITSTLITIAILIPIILTSILIKENIVDEYERALIGILTLSIITISVIFLSNTKSKHLIKIIKKIVGDR